MQIGILSGAGELPVIIARDARQRGYRVITVALEGLASPDMHAVSDEARQVNVGRLGEIIETFRNAGVKDLIMAGKVSKSLLYKSGISPDMRAVKLLFTLKDRSDDAILNALAKELEGDGINIIDTAAFSPHLLTPEGVIAGPRPSDDEWKDIAFGWRIAREIGRLDIGQTVVVKGRSVMAVEAIEGTDEAIIRGGTWAAGGAVVVKASKPQQDMRLDVPVVGVATIEAMARVSARVLAVEAGRSILINRDSVAARAVQAGISVVGYRQ